MQYLKKYQVQSKGKRIKLRLLTIYPQSYISSKCEINIAYSYSMSRKKIGKNDFFNKNLTKK